MIPDGTHKHCSHCREWLALEQFNVNRRMKDGLSSWCRECTRQATRRWREKHPEVGREYNEARRVRYRAEHPVKAKSCVVCGATFVRKPDAIVCSTECRRARQREQRRERHGREARVA